MKPAVAALLTASVAGAPAHAEPYLNFDCADGSTISLIVQKSGTGLVMVDGGAAAPIGTDDRTPRLPASRPPQH